MTNVLRLLIFVVVSAQAVAGEMTTWKADRAHSQVKFSVRHLVIAEVTGRFTDFDVTVQQPDDDFTHATIEATIKAASVNTDNERRDNHLRSDDFLNAEKYPAITFKSNSIERTGDNKYKVNGALTIRDVTKQVELETTYNGSIKDPAGNTKKGFKATTTINRFDYGVKWDKTTEAGGLIAGKDVELTLLMEFAMQKGN